MFTPCSLLPSILKLPTSREKNRSQTQASISVKICLLYTLYCLYSIDNRLSPRSARFFMTLASLAIVVLGTIVFTLINDYLPVGGDYIEDTP